LELVADQAFSSAAWEFPEGLVAHLQIQRRGFDHKDTEDPKLHDRLQKIQGSLLDHLLHGRMLTRLVDSALYGNEVSPGDVMSVLTARIFWGDANASPSALRQNLQVNYLRRLLQWVNSNEPQSVIQSAAFHEVMKIRDALQQQGQLAGAPAHKDWILYTIGRALDQK
jgi:hypothetical protein